MGRPRAVKRGEFWIVDLSPTIGSEVTKKRPALIVQNDHGNEHSPITIVAPVTSAHTDNIYPTDVPVTLEKPSKVLCNQIRAIDMRRLVKRIPGSVDMERVDEALRISLGLMEV